MQSQFHALKRVEECHKDRSGRVVIRGRVGEVGLREESSSGKKIVVLFLLLVNTGSSLVLFHQ